MAWGCGEYEKRDLGHAKGNNFILFDFSVDILSECKQALRSKAET
jgi:hypothetical protein